MTSNQNSSFSYSTNFTASIIFSSDLVWIRWSTQNKDEYEMRGEITDLTVGWISTFLMVEDSKLPILKRSLDDIMVFKQNMASWRSWWSRPWTAENLGSSSRKNSDRRKSSNERWWKWRIGPASMTDARPLRISPSLFTSESGILTWGSMISISSSSGFLAKIMAPITEATAPISSSSRSCPNDALTTVEYRGYKPFKPFPSPFSVRRMESSNYSGDK